MEILSAQSDQDFFSANSKLYDVFIDLEQAGIQEVKKDRPAELAAYDRAIANVQKSLDSLNAMTTHLNQEQNLLKTAGVEPGFDTALRKVDFDALQAKLIKSQVLPDRPGYYQKFFDRVKKEGPQALISGRSEGIEELRTMVTQFGQQLRDSRSLAADGNLIPSIDQLKIPAVLAEQRIYKMMNDDLALACILYSAVSKEARGTLGWK